MWTKEVADIEVYPDLFLYVAHDLEGEGQYEYCLSPFVSIKNTLSEYCDRMRSGIAMMGFNNKGYDQHVIHFILTHEKELCELSIEDAAYRIYLFSSDLINSDEKQWIRKKDVIVPQFDIFLLKHFNNKARSCSLKWIEFAMRDPNIEDLPYPPDEPLHDRNKVIEVTDYCHHDVRATKDFILECTKDIKLRQDLSTAYGLDLYDANDPKIGESIILKFVSEKMRMKSWDVKKMRTYRRGGIELKDLILPYVRFETDEFKAILQKFQDTTVFNTNGDIAFTADFRGIPYDYGVGGLHACCDSGSYHEDDEWMIYDIDVTSYYPNLAIRNKRAPQHLGQSFCDVYENIFETRKTFAKGTPENYGLKIALNGAYGKSNDLSSFLYDPEFTMFITVNGQLLLTMLAENILLQTSAILLQANTDGITVRVRRNEIDKVKELMSEWEKLTLLQLEDAEYKSMFIRDVNNYMAVTTDDEYKFKGAFEINKDWHKDHSNRIVPIAVARACIHDIPPEDTIDSHLEIVEYDDLIIDGEPCEAYGLYDFCSAVRARSGATFRTREWVKGDYEYHDLTKTVRYAVVNQGVDLQKVLPPDPNKKDKLEQDERQMHLFMFTDDVKIDADRVSFVESGHQVEILNTMKDSCDLNRDYYINECNKILGKL